MIDVQSKLTTFWRNSDYPSSFNNDALPHRHFNHALSHAMKALGGLAALSDAMDHERMRDSDPEMAALYAARAKYLADLVICAARMAQQCAVNLDNAVGHRVGELQERWQSRS